MQLDIFEAGCIDKVTTVKRICEEKGISVKNVAYIGDDINDLEVIRTVSYTHLLL